LHITATPCARELCSRCCLRATLSSRLRRSLGYRFLANVSSVAGCRRHPLRGDRGGAPCSNPSPRTTCTISLLTQS